MRRLALGILAVVLVGAIGWTADQTVRQAEYEALLDVAEAMDDPTIWMPYFEARACFPSDLPRTVNDQNVRRVYDAFVPVLDGAEHFRGELIRRTPSLRAVFIVPWHRSIRQARQALVSHEEVWIDSLDRQIGHLIEMHPADPSGTVEGWRGLADEIQQGSSTINGTFRAAEDAFIRAQPRFDWFGRDFWVRRTALFFPQQVLDCPVE